MIKDYVDHRIEDVANSRYYECCKKHLINELLDIKNLLDKEFQGEINEMIDEEQSASESV